MTEKAAHSPLGASGAERWMNCPGSYTLLKRLDLPVTEEADYAAEGTAAHEALAFLLARPAMDAWEIVGDKFYKGFECTAEMADGIQLFLDTVRPAEKEAGNIRTFIEYPIEHPDQPLFYGTLDFAVVTGKKLELSDFKFGQGIMVDVEENPQVMYYAYGILRDFPEIEEVVLRIIQPRGFHPNGPVREWMIDAEYIKDWGDSTLLPAMEVAQTELDFDAGKWCRFCPAKLVCPLMNSLFGAAMKADPKTLVSLTLEEIGRTYQYTEAVEQYIRALKEEAYRRLFKGENSEFIKLVPKKANRVWKPEATAAFAKFGADAFTKPVLKGPAEMEKLDGEARNLVREYAYTPLTGLTVALASDKRPGVKVETSLQAFPGAPELMGAA